MLDYTICFVSESLNNPAWSSCNFFLDGLMKASDNAVLGCRHSEAIPLGYDWYIDVDSARQKPAIKSRVDGAKVASLIFDLFDTDCDQSWRLDMARNSDVVIVTNECSRKIIRDSGINTPCFLITFGINDNVWYKKPIHKTCDSVFIGNICRKSSQKRKKVIDELIRSGYNIIHRHMDCFLEDNSNLLNSAKVGLEIPNDGYDNFGIRPLEIIGCGLPLLTCKDGVVERIIPDGLATYYKQDCSDVVEKYAEIMNNLEEKTVLANELKDYFLNKFTYCHVGKRILDILEGRYNEAELFCS